MYHSAICVNSAKIMLCDRDRIHSFNPVLREDYNFHPPYVDPKTQKRFHFGQDAFTAWDTIIPEYGETAETLIGTGEWLLDTPPPCDRFSVEGTLSNTYSETGSGVLFDDQLSPVAVVFRTGGDGFFAMESVVPDAAVIQLDFDTDIQARAERNPVSLTHNTIHVGPSGLVAVDPSSLKLDPQSGHTIGSKDGIAKLDNNLLPFPEGSCTIEILTIGNMPAIVGMYPGPERQHSFIQELMEGLKLKKLSNSNRTAPSPRHRP